VEKMVVSEINFIILVGMRTSIFILLVKIRKRKRIKRKEQILVQKILKIYLIFLERKKEDKKERLLRKINQEAARNLVKEKT
jgi:hypothetical protein